MADKELLLKDLCARLPYGLWIDDGYALAIHIDYSDVHFENYFNGILNGDVKPYLRPMSSMTEEEKSELKEYLDAEEVDCNGFGYTEGGTLEDYVSNIPYSLCNYVIDWLNKNMFDYRGLIPKGLALEATEGMYK